MDRFNDALSELEARIREPIDMAAIARTALVGEYHFRRTFATLAGMGIADYVKRRRMTLAAADVRDAELSLIEIAERFGYSSADSFTRAFRDVHGITPTQARSPGARLQSQSRITFRLSLEGATRMNHRIVPLGGFRIVGRAATVPLVHHGPNPAITTFLASIPVEVTLALKARNDTEPRGVLAVTDDVDPGYAEGTPLTYLHGVATTSAAEIDDDTFELPASDWLVLEPVDPSDEALQALWPYAVTEWFPSNPYELASGPSIVTMQRSPDTDELQRALWMPIQRHAELR